MINQLFFLICSVLVKKNIAYDYKRNYTANRDSSDLILHKEKSTSCTVSYLTTLVIYYIKVWLFRVFLHCFSILCDITEYLVYLSLIKKSLMLLALNWQDFHPFIFSKHFIVLGAKVDPEPIMWTLWVNWSRPGIGRRSICSHTHNHILVSR